MNYALSFPLLHFTSGLPVADWWDFCWAKLADWSKLIMASTDLNGSLKATLLIGGIWILMLIGEIWVLMWCMLLSRALL